MKKNILLNLILMISAVFSSLIMAEVLLHFFHPVTYRVPPQKLPENVWRELIHRHSSIPGLAYELVPNLENHTHGILIKTNSLGMRDDEPRPEDDDSLHRIAVIGDSFTFGFGVSGEQTYSNVLEHLLNTRIDGEKFEVLNFGVGGYSTRDEALVLKHKAIDWDLDLVVVGYYFNDPEIDPVQELHSHYQDPLWWQYSNLLRLIAKNKQKWDVRKLGSGNYFRYLHSRNGYKWKSVVDALGDIESVSTKREIPVLLVIFPVVTTASWAKYPYKDLHQQVADAAKEAGIHVVDLCEVFSKYSGASLIVKPTDGHPSQFGHEVTAEAIYQWIVENEEQLAFSTQVSARDQ